MTRPIRCSCEQHVVVWSGALWRHLGETAASLLDGRGRERKGEDPRLAGVKGHAPHGQSVTVKGARNRANGL